MNAPFDKALLWLIPYLYVISIVYYWGYWGTFEIDVFNYYAVSDLVKGVISPVKTVISTLLVVFIALLAAELLNKAVEGKSNKIILLATLAACVPIIWWLTEGARLAVGDRPDVSHEEGTELHTTIYTACTAITGILAIMIYRATVTSNQQWVRTTYFLGIYALLIFPFRTFFTAKDDALRILQNKEFTYVVSDSLILPKKSIYKYLGKVGEYHILLTLDNYKSIIVPAEKISPLVLQRVSITDSLSMARYKANKQVL